MSESNCETEQPKPTPRRGKGRPSLGKPVLVVMADQDVSVAKKIGDSVIAEGVRRALRTYRQDLAGLAKPTDAEEPKPRRGKGRPSLGKPVLVVLSDQDVSIAKEIGGGVIAEGVRRALRAAELHLN